MACALLALAALAPPAAVQAQPTPGGAAPSLDAIPACHAPDPGQQHADAEVLKGVMQSLPQGGYPLIRAHAAELQAVLDHVPAGMGAVERCGDQIVVRTSLTDLLLYSARYGPALKGQAKVRRIELDTSPALLASLLLGSLYDEDHDFPRAYAALQVGLRIDPGDAKLAAEASICLSQMSRFDEALAVVDRALAGPGAAEPRQHARLLRAKGSALEGLQRWDDAEGAYQASLAIEPANAVARNELGYIARRRAGGAQTPLVETPSGLSRPSAPAPAGAAASPPG